ncbi:hypothetical protein Moror_6991 [Moniliophthora roreri MCA 2997]|uniref:Methyltransferase domain-containing protein n=1 Tax=Moniliophthora roreri (strain MCA 2997) TaxID=1381753 RepID=V2XBB1_MONRO|nr:hypothetical protein Moror_6991 [Moniliophthora roreri MCA 2997]
MSSEEAKYDYVVLTRGEAERERLNRQFWFYKKFHGRDLIIDSRVTVPFDGAVLDSATGSGAWVFALANELPSTVSLHAVDLAPALWISKGVPPNVHYTVSSVTSLPKDWDAKFDLVNQALLSTSLKEADWSVNISELYRVTKPGGHIQLVESIGMGEKPPSDQAGSILWEVFVRMRANSGFLDSAFSQVPPMLEEAGFCEVSVQKKPAPRFGINSGEEVLDIMKRALAATKEFVVSNDFFGVVKDEKEYDALLERHFKETAEQCLPVGLEMCLICAKKPA